MNTENLEALQKRFEFVHENYHQLCRFCLDTKNLLTIFHQAESCREENSSRWTYNQERNIGKLLQKQYVQFDPDEEYGMPNNICERCVDCLVQWHRFQETFTTSTKLLLKMRDHFQVNKKPEGDQENGKGEHVEDSSPDDNALSDDNEVYEIEFLQNLPENVTVEDVTIIESIEAIEEGSEGENIKHFAASSCSNDQHLKLVIEREDGKSEPNTIDEGVRIPQPHRKRRRKEMISPREKSKHVKRKLKSRGTQCPICGMIVKAKMKHHLLRHSDPTGQPFKCPDCEKSYSFKRTLVDHIRQVHQNVRYGCEMCGKEFVSRDVLRIHRKLHTNEEHRCDICAQVFQQRMYLKKHMAVHDEKKFSCDECGKVFRFNEQLKQHTRVHTGEKPFRCESCPKCFRTSSHLKQHMRTHTQEKVFKCKQCRVEYANKKSLERHVAGSHPSG